MRNNFINKLTDLAEKDKEIVLLTGDLGFGVFEKFESSFPGQYYNVGVAEQNMIGLATGLALEGKKIVTYSIGNFGILRCLEQIRNDACYHEVNLTIVSNGGGFSYGALGMSHHTTEDLAIMRALPNMTVVAPCTEDEVGEATKALVLNKGVGYLRLDKNGAKDLFSEKPFTLGKSSRYKEGKDITLIAIGSILTEANIASLELKKIGIETRLVGMHTIKPIDIDEIADSATNTGGIVVIEEHNKNGGLGSAISEVCMDLKKIPNNFLRIGLENEYSSIVGDQNYLRSHYKIDSKTIIREVKKILKL